MVDKMNELKKMHEERIAIINHSLRMAVFAVVAVCGMLAVKWSIDNYEWPDEFGLRKGNWRNTVSAPQDTPINTAADDIQSLGHGVHVFPHTDFPRRLAEFIDTNSQTQVFAVCPLGTSDAPKAGFLVLTRPDPEWLKILPGSAAPPDNIRPGG